MFRLSEWLPTRTARTRAACVSLSFFNDVKQPGGFRGLQLLRADANVYRFSCEWSGGDCQLIMISQGWWRRERCASPSVMGVI